MNTNDPALIKQHIDNTNRAGGADIVNADAHHLNANHKLGNHDDIEDNTDVSNNTETFDEDVVDTEHVNDGDNPARQPDRRDQQGSTAFDEGVNEETVGSSAPKSEGINEMNRYASVENAQSRILSPDEKD